MKVHEFRRALLTVATAAAAAVTLAGCVTSPSATTSSTADSSSSNASSESSSAATGSGAGHPSSAPSSSEKDSPGPLVIQSRFTGAEKKGLEAVIKSFEATGAGKVTLNTLPSTTFAQKIPSYLTSENPPDIYTWFGGEATRAFADQGLLLDVSDVWNSSLQNFSSAQKKLATDSKGQQVFIPTDYYWWGIYYNKPQFQKLGIAPPKTWDEFLAACAKIKAAGVVPITAGASDNAWLLTAWFDYLDLRINGATFHLDLLAGKHSFDSPQVKKVFDAMKQVLPYLDPNVLGTSYNQSLTEFSNEKVAMYLSGAFIETGVPSGKRSDLAFFQFPTIDPAVPDAEEGPMDGLIASSRTTRPNLVKKFLAFIATPEAQSELVAGQDGISLAANPAAKQQLDPLAAQGKEMLEQASQITQFFNRDAGDQYEAPADAAMSKFVSQKGEGLDSILAEWQQANEKIRNGQ